MTENILNNAVLPYLLYGKQNAKTKTELMALSGVGEREVRLEIEKLRREGLIVCNDQDGKGYYFSKSTDDILRQYRQLNSRAMSLLVQRKYLQKMLKDRGYIFKGRGGNVERKQI